MDELDREQKKDICNQMITVIHSQLNNPPNREVIADVIERSMRSAKITNPFKSPIYKVCRELRVMRGSSRGEGLNLIPNRRDLILGLITATGLTRSSISSILLRMDFKLPDHLKTVKKIVNKKVIEEGVIKIPSSTKQITIKMKGIKLILVFK